MKKTCSVVFCSEILQQFSPTFVKRLLRSYVFLSHGETLHCENKIDSIACHVIFERAHRVENLTKYRADDLCVNLVCEYFCWKLGDPHFFFGRSLPFLTLAIILKSPKNLCVGSFNYLSYTTRKGSNWYMDIGVRDLEDVFFKANSSRFKDM